MFTRIWLMVVGLLLPTLSFAGRLALEPQTRVHAGLSVAGGPMDGAPSLGAALGMDARMTRLLSLDVGGFLSPGEAPSLDTPAEDGAGSIFLRHGIFVAPGVRIPHRASEKISWDVVFRAGFGGVWWTDVQAQETVGDDSSPFTGMSPSLLGGVDLLLRQDAWGLRVGGKAFGFRAFSDAELNVVSLARPQASAELLYQW